MMTFADIIDAFGGPVSFGDAIGIRDSHARTMKARDSIPSSRWASVVSAAANRGIDGVTLELLARIEADRASQRSARPS